MTISRSQRTPFIAGFHLQQRTPVTSTSSAIRWTTQVSYLGQGLGSIGTSARARFFQAGGLLDRFRKLDPARAAAIPICRAFDPQLQTPIPFPKGLFSATSAAISLSNHSRSICFSSFSNTNHPLLGMTPTSSKAPLSQSCRLPGETTWFSTQKRSKGIGRYIKRQIPVL
jgi:hypothetical protein